ncbi:hypothetical protein LNP74_25325 [Klebsiella pneumoniae subsp. pneumoniae]|nr:hypothetical protein [Klebsiella pneumoniae subsp. pneumoniae]
MPTNPWFLLQTPHNTFPAPRVRNDGGCRSPSDGRRLDVEVSGHSGEVA